MDNIGIKRKFTVSGIGEILWDVLPSGKKLGGAPANFAYHINSLGCIGIPVSSVGADKLGNEILEVIRSLNLTAEYLQVDPGHSTGTVEVKVDTEGKPKYKIHEDVAWDNIRETHSFLELAKKSDAVCFGSLAQRFEISRASIVKFISEMLAESLKIFDVNLRQNYFSENIILKGLQISNCLKLNDAELPIISDLLGITGSENELLKQISSEFEIGTVALTKGSEGSTLLSGGEFSYTSSEEVVIVDTVGAGDAFTAGLVFGLLNKIPLAKTHRIANKLASFVCTQSGATPSLPASLIKELIN